VAQTKRRRQTKHRGDATGAVVARGRTGRKPTTAEKSESARRTADSRERRQERLNRPPTWRGAFVRALVAAVLVLAASLFLLGKKNEGQAFLFFPIVVLIYVPCSYYTDLWLYRRRQRKQAVGAAKGGRD
jgi:cytochrome c-type biogenesis protein CcmH/NrfG